MRSLASLLVPVLGLLAGCEIFAYADRDLIDAGKGGAGGANSASSASGAGGAGGTACIQGLDCPGVDTDCRARTCVHGFCAVQFAKEGTATTSQVSGDCQKSVCDGAGQARLVEDPLDPLDDHNPCTDDTCVGGVPHNAPSPASDPCGTGGVCDGAGSCVGCVLGAQCGGLLCVSNHCVPSTCLDQVQDGSETSADCGGPACGPCDDLKPCVGDGDCKSGLCTGTPRLCASPSCSDGVKNGSETDVDCGGTCPTPCGAGQGCQAAADCTGNACSGSVCLPACNDGARNGSETGVDCGGPACAPCSNGGGCDADGDCFYGVCRAGLCRAPTCLDGMKDGDESDVDCGGGCPACPPGKACVAGGDCTSQVCAGTLCASVSCSDHAQNGGETGVDCGGATACPRCPDGQGCVAGSDCAGALCVAQTCVPPSCSDGVLDLDETDIDCGGTTCPGCPGGGACEGDGDCQSTVCQSGACTTASCSDAIQNQGETDVDCGGPSCLPCPKGKGCHTAVDCQTVACAGGVCVDPTCSDATHNGQETGVDCGGPTCGRCSGGQGCAVAGDCASMACTAGLCAATCTDGLKDGAELGVDCGGGTCPGCALGTPCQDGADCASQVCAGGICTAASCSDMIHNGDESDVDCGGGTCPVCANGRTCSKNADCASQGCRGGKCVEVLLISEVRSHGTAGDGYGDDFVELYNPGSAAITVTSTWTVAHQSAQGGCQAGDLRFTGSGQSVPSHGHLLLGGWEYAQMPPEDVLMVNSNLARSIADAGSIWVANGGVTLDAVCFYYDTASLTTLGGCTTKYICEGTPISNLPHNGSSQASSAVDVSFERKPGGALGNGQDTDDNATDFQQSKPANPQDLASPPTP